MSAVAFLTEWAKRCCSRRRASNCFIMPERFLMKWKPRAFPLQHLGKWGQSRLRIGASTTACQHILPSVLREFKAEFPQMSLSLEPGDTPEAIQLLRSNSIDLALVLEPRHEEQF